MNPGPFPILLLLIGLTACSSAPQRTGSREKLNERSITLESVRYQLSRQGDGIALGLVNTISADMETLVKYQHEVRTITAGWVDQVGPVFSLFALPFTLAADVVTLGQHKRTKSEEKFEGKERKRMEVPAPDGAQVNGYFTLTDGETEARLMDRAVSLPVKNGRTLFPLPRDAGNCVAAAFRGDVLAYGQSVALSIDEHLGCENVLTREDHLWRTLRDDADEYRAYLDSYPKGKYAEEARRRIARLSTTKL